MLMRIQRVLRIAIRIMSDTRDKEKGERQKQRYLARHIDVINVETNITNVAIRIMRDGVRGVYEGWSQPPLKI